MTRMKLTRHSVQVCVLSLIVAAMGVDIGGPLVAQTIDVELLRRKQETQQRARDMARELVSGVLDIQLQQLEENGLDELPLFRDISQMRANIDGLVEAEMAAVVKLLLKAQDEGPKDRELTFIAARQKIREVVIRLTIERQNLLRRLKAAELAAQVKRLIGLETVVLNTTESLPQLPKGKQESTALSTVQDQRDVKALYLRLVETLQDVRGWGGEVGHGAADGLTILKTMRTDEELDASVQKLEATDYATAQTREVAVIKGLRLLLEKIEETQGLIGANREAALEMVRDLMKQQEKLREETKKTDLNDATADPLVQKQTDIQKEVAKLPELLNDTNAALPLAEQAKAAARAATAELFEAKQTTALAEQSKVLGNLAEIERQIMAAAESQQSDKSAEEYGKLVRDLEKTRDDLKTAEKKTAETQKAAEKEPAAAKPLAEKVSKELAKINEDRKLPPVIEARVKDAAAAAAEAAQSLDDPEAEPGKPKAALENTQEAIVRAEAEVEAALADAKRHQLAVEVGELARAAEALDRAAAAEREIAKDAAEQAKGKKGLDPVQVAKMKAEQAEVGEVVKKVAEAVKNLAPEAKKTLDEADKAAQAAGEQLKAAEKAPDSSQQAQKLGEQAKSASDKMTAAADQLRSQIAKPAEQLAKEATKQLAAINPVRAETDNAAAKPTDSLADRLANLAKAEEKVREAAIDQQRASGRKEAAEAMDLSEAIAQAAAQQKRAQQAAEDLAQGKAPTALEAAIKQQQVAEATAKAGEQAAVRPQAAEAKKQGQPDPLSDTLKQAQKAAAQAAKDTLDGNPKGAKAAQQQAEAALAKAAEMAEAEAQQAAKAPAGNPDADAQQQVGEAAAEAAKMAAADAPAANKELAKAEASSGEAQEKAKAGQTEDTAKAQQAAAQSLETAKAQIKEAQKQLAQKQAEQMAKQSAEAGKLAAQAATVDPPAQAALKSAEKAAAEAAEQGDMATPEQAKAAAQEVDMALERAAASLSARQQRVERDKALAEAMLQQAKAQQAAAKEIAQARDELANLDNAPPANNPPADGNPTPPGKPNPAPPQSPAQAQAANKLNQAMQAFAQAQIVTGQAAQEVSGQTEVANKPLREALEIASQLTPEPMPPAEGSELAQAPAGNAPPAGQQPTPANGQPQPPAGSPSGTPPGTPQGTPPGEPAGQPAGQPAAEPGQPTAAQPGATKSGQAAQMGTQFAPASPEVTAQMLAGPQALAQLAAAQLANPSGPKPPAGEATASAQPMPAKPGDPKDGESKNGAGTGGPTKGSPKPNNTADAKPGQHTFREEPWVAKLPPELRDAIRAQGERRPPRGYEERLRRYFENID